MGGKTAVALGAHAPERLSSLTIVDIAPITYPDTPKTEQRSLMEAMLAIDLNVINSRKDADRILMDTIENSAIRAFALLGLERKEGKWRWQSNLPQLLNSLPILRQFPALPYPAIQWTHPSYLRRTINLCVPS